MPPLKYIADGFLYDAKKLLDDFTMENSMEFTVFANIWKKHNFSLIYMGRPTKKELNEFTNEIFHLTGKYLFSKSRIYQVGGIYLWYGLYLNQITEPPIRIRITLDQAEIVVEISEFAEANKEQSLHFVLNYLFENAFEFVALPTLMGPFMRKDPELLPEQNETEEFELDTGLMKIKQSGILEDIYEIFKEYSKHKKSQYPIYEYKKYINQLDGLLSLDVGIGTKESCNGSKESCNGSKESCNGSKESCKTELSKPGSSKSGIGLRRAQLKSAQFSRSIFPHHDSDLNEISDLDGLHEAGEDSSAPEPMPKQIQRPRSRALKKERKLGRPRKNVPEMTFSSDSDSIDGAIELPTSNLFSETKHRYEKVRRIRRYYEENPGESKK